MSSSSLRPSWGVRLRAHLALARLSNSPTVVSNVLAGAALGGAAGPGIPGLGGVTGLVAAAMVLFYSAGMYLNDLLDLEIDRRERPERPLPSGLLTPGEALAVILLLVALGGAALWAVGPAALGSGLGLTALIVVYDLWHKANPLSPVLMACTRMLVYLTAFLALGRQASAPLLEWTLLLGGYIVGLTYVAKTERQAGPGRYWPAALVLLPAPAFLLERPGLPGWLLLLAFLAWSGYSLSFVYRSRGRSVGRAVGHLIAGVSLLDALVLASQGAWSTVPLAL
ncbi:MAG: UbiA family prenyltransferase, partial [Deinococcus sp.]